MGKRFNAVAVLAASFALIAAGIQPAQSQDFYQGKTITFVVGASPGGSLDTYSRLIGRHIGRYVPGNPSVIVQNMPGAGSLVAANHTYNKAPPDGLTVGSFAPALVLQQILGRKGVKFDGRKFGWLGSPSSYHSICVMSRESGIRSVEDWMSATRPPNLSGMGPGAGPSDIPRTLNAALGLPLKLVEGYRGGSKVRHALELGEVDGYCGSWEGVRRVWADRIKAGKFVIVIQAGLESHPELAHVPMATKYAKTDDAKLLLDVNETIHGNEFVFAMPPGTPAERLQLLRTAFMTALKSPELKAEGRKIGLENEPVDGAAIGRKLNALYDLPAGTVSKLKAALMPKKKK